MELVVLDIGGTHARFALARIGERIEIGEPFVLRTGDYACLEDAWVVFATHVGGALPNCASIAAAGPLRDGAIKLTNASWILDVDNLVATLRLNKLTALNDFAAVGHAVDAVPEEELVHLAGPDRALPRQGVVSVLGPGTGLGVAHILRANGACHVQATEGGHVGFAPQDELDEVILTKLSASHRRVVTEHVHSGQGIASIYSALGGTRYSEPRAIWDAGLSCEDELAIKAIDRFCASLGGVAGDFALAHGAAGVVIAGGLGLRLRNCFARSQFAQQFAAKPRYEAMMASIPVKLLIHPNPGLLGAAAAFMDAHR
jgi:glucokinase